MLISTDAFGMQFLAPENDFGIGQTLRASGEFAKVESDLIIDYLRAEPGTFIDVGANLGTIALPVAQAVGTRVIAIEAQRVMAMLLSANVCNNRLLNIDVIPAAAGAQSGLVRFPQGRLDQSPVNYGMVGARFLGHAQLTDEEVRVCALDDIAPEDTRFVKIDVEGAEPAVLAGASRLIHEVRPVWLLEATENTMTAARETMRVMLAANYRLFWFYAPFVTPQAIRPGKQNMTGDLNFVALPEGAPNLWDLPPLDSAEDAVPGRATLFGYLARYGFRFSPSP
jgi:FkbM family methyltransferase